MAEEIIVKNQKRLGSCGGKGHLWSRSILCHGVEGERILNAAPAVLPRAAAHKLVRRLVKPPFKIGRLRYADPHR